MSENKKNRGVIITASVLAAVFIVSCIAVLKIINSSEDKKTALIYSGGKLIKEISLDNIDEPVVLKVESEDGGYNIIEAENGKIHVKEASCPDKVCMNTGYISSSALPISCLPNKLIIKIEGNKSEDEPDIIVY